MHKKTVILSLILSICIAAMGWIGFVRGYVHEKGTLENTSFVMIPKGATVSSASEILVREGITGYKGQKWGLFKMTYYAFYKGQTIKAGEYQFEPAVTPFEVLRKLTEGDIYYRKLTIPEGLTTTEILAIISAAQGLEGDVPGDIDEGELMPQTYLYTTGDTRAGLVKEIYTKQYQLLESLWNSRAPGLPFKDKNEALTLASIVEKETSLAAERAEVAGVYVNRLKKKMKLQADPTVVYALTNGKSELGRDLRTKDLQFDSPYNTYKYNGLPPGPICNPGVESIRAVLNPAETKNLYFVADGLGGHTFTTNVNDHNKAVRAYRKSKKKDIRY